MTTLNTIIEEEKKEFEEKIDTICKQADQYQINAGYPVDTPAKMIVLSLFTTAMQRAYEAGKADNAQANTPDTEGGCCKGCKTATNKSEWDKGNVYCSNRECKCHTPDTEWEKEFDEKFVETEYFPNVPMAMKFPAPYIKDFIRELLTSRDTYWKERVRKVVEAKKPRIAGSMHQSYNDGKMDALDDLLQELDNLK